LRNAPDRLAYLLARLDEEYDRVRILTADRIRTSANTSDVSEISPFISPTTTANNKGGENGKHGEQCARLVISLEPPQATIDGTPYALKVSAAKLLKALHDAADWVNGKSVINQPSRVVATMPEKVRRIIESSPGKGFRVNLSKVI
jgi:hypothetical protein